MELELLRFSSQEESTLGILNNITSGLRQFLCFTLEDEWRAVKKHGETRIPEGTYSIHLRTVGGFHKRYSERFPEFHQGMLHLQDVPGFEYILIHIGNFDDNTEGCILVGDNAKQNITAEGFVGESTDAYKRIYPPIAEAILTGEPVTIRIVDLDVYNHRIL